jgi:iron only hydrogenase large subunit-like protein
VELIRNRYPELKKFLLPFDSPMAAMAKIIRKNYPSHRIVFLAPCPSKKAEARAMNPRIIDASVTFSEMKVIVGSERPSMRRGPHLFDSFYNDYTKVYPLSGGLSGTLHSKDILLEREMVACDGCTDIVRLFSSHPDKVFYDILFCSGGCIGGPGVSSKMPLYLRKKSIMGYTKVAAKESMRGAQGLDRYVEGLNFDRKF